MTDLEIKQLIEKFRDAFRDLETEWLAQRNVIVGKYRGFADAEDRAQRDTENAKKNQILKKKLQDKYERLAADFEVAIRNAGLATAIERLIQEIRKAPIV